MSALGVILWALAVLVVMFVGALVLLLVWLAGEVVGDALRARRQARRGAKEASA